MKDYIMRVTKRNDLMDNHGYTLCENCDGDGIVNIDMMVDPPFYSYSICDECDGLGAVR